MTRSLPPSAIATIPATPAPPDGARSAAAPVPGEVASRLGSPIAVQGSLAGASGELKARSRLLPASATSTLPPASKTAQGEAKAGLVCPGSTSRSATAASRGELLASAPVSVAM